MKKLLEHKKILLLAADLLLIPALLFFRWYSGYMLSTDSVCSWTLLGGKCVTCGGTHFVNALLHGRVAEAFSHNSFLFLLTIFVLVSYILLHLSWLWEVPFAKKCLSRVYSTPGLIVGLSIMLVFFFCRNIPAFVRVYEILTQS